MSNQEQEFIQRALANVEKAEKRMRMKHVVLKVLTLGAAIWFGYRSTGPELSFGWVILVVAGGFMAIITKILTVMNTNTKVILQALADMRPSIK